jgi:hypothetical protein
VSVKLCRLAVRAEAGPTTAPSVQVDVRQEKIERTFMAGTGFPAGSPQADLGRPDRRIEGQLTGVVSYSHCRPLPVDRSHNSLCREAAVDEA